MDTAAARDCTQELWPTLSHPEAHWMVAMSLAAGIADPPLAVWASRSGDNAGYLVVGSQLYIARPTLDDAGGDQNLSLSAKPLSADTWTAEMKSRSAPAGLGGAAGLKTIWEFRCSDGETLKVEGEIIFQSREPPGEMNKAEVFARQFARQLGWNSPLP
jgi:hypothetical protein